MPTNQNRASLITEGTILFPNNNTQEITPADLRQWLDDGTTSFVTQKDKSTMENAFYEAKSSNISAAGLTDLSAATGNFVHITVAGTPTITSFGVLPTGARFVLVFEGVCDITYNATSLIIPGLANKTTAAGDCCMLISEGSGNWRIVGYFAASGSGGGGITALTGDVTASGTGSVAATISNGAVDIPMLSATGTPSSLTFLRGDNTWQIPSAGATSTVQHQVKLDEAINKGQAVYVYGADGTNMLVRKASNTSEATSSKTMGLIDASGAANAFVNVVTEGLLAGLNTNAAGAAGDPVWLGVNGDLLYGLINKPYAPDHLVFIGIVTRKNAVNGEIFVKVQNGFELKELHDVQAQTPSLKDTLYYDNTVSPAQWKTAQINTIAPSASATVTGLVDTSAQEFAGIKTFGNGAGAGEIRIKEPSGSGTNSVGIKAQAMAADYSLTLPEALGGAGNYLSTDAFGVLSWQSFGSTSYKAYRQIGKSAGVTNTNVQTPVVVVEIPANSFKAGECFQISTYYSKEGTIIRTYQLGIYFNTVNNLTGSPVFVADVRPGSGVISANVVRELAILSASGASNNVVFTTGTGGQGAFSPYAGSSQQFSFPSIDWTTTQYLIVGLSQTGTPLNATETGYSYGISIVTR